MQREFSNPYLRPPRKENISPMSDAGMNIRSITTATNMAVGTVHKEASKSSVQTRAPDHADLENAPPSEGLHSNRILDQDGRTYPASRPEALTESDTSRDEPTEVPVQRTGHMSCVDLGAVLDAPEEDVYVTFRNRLQRCRQRICIPLLSVAQLSPKKYLAPRSMA